MTAQDARSGDMDAQVVLAHLGRGRDHALTLGALAESMGWYRRRVELAVRALRMEGWIIGSGGRGVWLADPVEAQATIDSLHRRIVSQYLTLRKMRDTVKRHGYTQTTLFDAA